MLDEYAHEELAGESPFYVFYKLVLPPQEDMQPHPFRRLTARARKLGLKCLLGESVTDGQQQRFREAQYTQREMSQLERQHEEMEEYGRQIEQELRDTEGRIFRP